MANRAISVPIDHHPGMVRGEGPSANAARTAMTALHEAWGHISRAAADESVELPRLARAAQAAMERALTEADKATTAISKQVAHLETAIVAATQPRQDPTLAMEIRSHWRATGWQKGLIPAVQADARTASAILSAPAYLSGLDAEKHGLVRLAATKAHAPEQSAALEEALLARERVETASTRIIEVVVPRIREWTTPENESLTALETTANV